MSIKTKTCFKCNTEYSIESFHKHAKMADGRLNKCKYCVKRNVDKWREANPDYRKKEHAKVREKKGFMTRDEWRENLAANAIGRKVSSTKYAHKRRMLVSKPMSEWDEFVLEEALSLAAHREATTGIKWHVDHIVPLLHEKACGLHTAANLQVVPASWNFKKGNRHMQTWDRK